MSAERGWIIPPRPNLYSVEAWAERHRRDGHNPHPAPTAENPEQWECKCDPDAAWTAVWRILTLDQIRRKYAHLSRRPSGKRPPDPQMQQHIAEIEAEQERRNEELHKRDYSHIPPLQIVEPYRNR
ncbi:hypothetical protein [Mycobacterium avium]|uniref:hypothetical protein n=1 Tax=Mycobacterium avium TaxID=1764 RepID=UPI00111C3C70|nr:hypothetical protein [Mycobacterium avium]